MKDDRLNHYLLSANKSRAVFLRVLIQAIEQNSCMNQLLYEKCVFGLLMPREVKTNSFSNIYYQSKKNHN